ncbi:hypothetical protein [Pseudogemmobacter bohemicus]|uniref:hypothetical protein n=1 Tax=Pseudogemmobacter bohemicus TaxID=2250708 RepID=UPI0013009604|nr:hypothetical protein [Pseudogemmobacter bohemicus]
MQAILLGFSFIFTVAAILILRHALRLRRHHDREPESQDDFTLAMQSWSDLEGNR